HTEFRITPDAWRLRRPVLRAPSVRISTTRLQPRTIRSSGRDYLASAVVLLVVVGLFVGLPPTAKAHGFRTVVGCVDKASAVLRLARPPGPCRLHETALT